MLQESHQIGKNSKFNAFGLSPVHMQNTWQRSFLGFSLLLLSNFQIFCGTLLEFLEYKKDEMIIIVRECLVTR